MIATPLTMTIIHGINIAAENNFTRRFVNEIYKHCMFVFNGKCFLNYASVSTIIRRNLISNSNNDNLKYKTPHTFTVFLTLRQQEDITR